MTPTKFPTLSDGQLALLICESTTGIVLNEKLEWGDSGIDHIYYIFESKEKAIVFIELKKKPNIVFTLYDKNKKIVFRIDYPPFL